MNAVERKNRIVECLSNLAGDDLIQAWNTMCDEECWTERVYPMSSIWEYLMDWEPDEIFNEFAGNKSFDPIHNFFFCHEIYGLESFDYFSDDNCPIDYSDLADYIERTDDDCHLPELKDLLEELNDEEDEA